MSGATAYRHDVHDPLDDWPDDAPAATSSSAWRPVFEEINKAVGGRRDEVATIGSINWLRHAMEAQDANPNVVRNIIYRDKGRLHDKRALYQVLQELRKDLGLKPITDPALTYLGSAYAAAELEVSQVLGREQRRVYRVLVGGIRAGGYPRLLVVGKPGSGKTMLADYIQRALQHGPEPVHVVRFDFSEADLSAALVRFGTELGLETGLVESKLVRIGTRNAFAVQADAQADVARAIIEHLRHDPRPRALLLHLSQGLNRPGKLGAAPLRLNTPEVPRATAAEWLWSTLIRQLATLPSTAMYLSTATAAGVSAGQASDPQAATVGAATWLDGPLKLAAPTSAEARRFVQAHAPQLDDAQREEIVGRAGRSYEALRTLSLLALLRNSPESGADDELTFGRLAALVEPGADARLRSFLTALSVLSTPLEATGFDLEDLLALLPDGKRGLSSVEQAFVDPVPGRPGHHRSFSRRLARELQGHLSTHEVAGWRQVQLRAADLVRAAATREPGSAAAERFLHHTLEARDWSGLTSWLEEHPVAYAALEKIWDTARAELDDHERLEDLALAFAAQLVRLGAVEHVEAVRAFELLAASNRPTLRAWTGVLRAQAEVAAGRFERAEVLLDVSPSTEDPVLEAERRLAMAGVLRWRGELAAATEQVAGAAAVVREAAATGQAAAALAAKTAVWSGVVAKDSGDLEAAIEALWSARVDDDLIEARLSFQRGDVAMQMGLFDVAGAELNRAVSTAERSGALPQERARFAARLGTLARLNGDHEGSVARFGAAREVLAASGLEAMDAAFARAMIDDEASYALLAKGDFEGAIVAGTTAIATYRDQQRRRDVDADFRLTRAALRLAVAYAFRGLGLPYRRPLPLSAGLATLAVAAGDGNPDLEHARESLAELRERLVRPGHGLVRGSSAVRGLLREARLVGSYIAREPAQALELAEAASDAARFDYQRAEAHTGRANALLRLGRPDDALAALDTAGELLGRARVVASEVIQGRDGGVVENGDLGLLAQIANYRAGAQLAAHAQLAAAETLCRGLEDSRLSPFHEGLLRAFGEGAHGSDEQGWRRHRRLRSLLGMNGTGPSTPARLPDALVAAWRSRT